jgi:glycosyltransferase involved in cell wall biosynthesis
MINNLDFYHAKEELVPKFSILIPSWNNLPFLILCIESIRKNSTFHHQIIVHVNEGTDGTPEWLKDNNISYTQSKINIGVCYGFNAPALMAESEYICLIDDDMYVCPGWDLPIWNEIKQQENEFYCISGTLIEPSKTRNTCVIAPYDFGNNPSVFKEKELLEQYNKFPFSDWNGCNWYPMVIHRNIWNLIGGLSIEFTPGMYSDPDFMMKLWHLGIRYFKGLSESRTYHFSSRTTSRVKRNNGRKQFLLKWGMSSSTFFKYYLKIGTAFKGSLTIPEKNIDLKMTLVKDKIKHIFTF